jgi:hypothetical protein
VFLWVRAPSWQHGQLGSSFTTERRASLTENLALGYTYPGRATVGGWCNGSTEDFGSFDLGSNPSPPAMHAHPTERPTLPRDWNALRAVRSFHNA